MNTKHSDIGRSLFWYPFRPWLRWPVRLLGIAGIIAVLVRLVVLRHWDDCFRFLFPVGLFAASFETPEQKPKTLAYLVGAVLAWVAVVMTLAFITFWIFNR